MERPALITAQRLLVEHGIFPGDYLRRPPGERVLIRALLIDHRRRKDGDIRWPEKRTPASRFP